MSGHNQQTSGPRLRVAIIGDGERLTVVGALLRGAARFEVLGQAGMPQSSALADIPWSDDARILVTSGDVQAVIAAGSTRTDIEAAELAVQRGLSVWRLPPLARSFTEGHEIIKHLGRDAPVYRVASWWEHVADQAWNEVAWPSEFRPVRSELLLSATAPPFDSWRRARGHAGGGVLALDAHRLLEALIATRGLPDSVFAITSPALDIPPAATGHDAEALAVAVLRYPASGVAWVRAVWSAAPHETTLTHVGTGLAARLATDELVVSDNTGAVVDRRPINASWLAADLQRFSELVQGQARDRAMVTLERHLAVAALLEAAYLAANTNHPESPGKFYEVVGRTVPR